MGHHFVLGTEKPLWMIHPGAGTSDDYRRFELHTGKIVREPSLLELEPRLERATGLLASVPAWQASVSSLSAR